MKSFFSKTWSWIKLHKKTSMVLGIIVLFLGYKAVSGFGSDTAAVSYVSAQVERGSVISSVSGSGQVSASNQVTLTSKASGDITSVNVKVGDHVKQGQLIASTDLGNAGYELESAQLSYQKLVTVDKDDLENAQNSLDQAKTDLANAYITARGELGDAVTAMTDVTDGLSGLLSSDNILSSDNYTMSAHSRELRQNAETAYYNANRSLINLKKKFISVTSATPDSDIERYLAVFIETATEVDEAAKVAQDAVIYIKDREDISDDLKSSAYSSVTGLVTKAHQVLSDLASSQETITNNRHTLENSAKDVGDVQDGPDTLDLRSETLSLRQKQDAVSDHYVRAPFDGIIATLDAKVGDNAGSGTQIATLITQDKIAEISLNEVDAAKVAVGQKATLTFDAIDGLTISGEVAEIDLVGTVTQGVVSYKTKIKFDTDDERVKSGMSVSANIITSIKQDVLTIENSAIKSQGDTTYVQVMNNGVPENVDVVTGVSNDEVTELVSGLNEGDSYIASTVTASTQTTAQAPSLFGGGARTGAAGATRFGR